MLIVKATKSTMQDLQITPVKLDISDLFYSWHVNFFILNRKKHYVFMNDLARLSLTVSGIRSNQLAKLPEIFLSNLQKYLISEGISEKLIDAYLDNCNQAIYAKTDSRSVLATLNEIMGITKSFEGEENEKFADLIQLNQWNNRIIYKPIEYKKPIDVFKQELEREFGKS